MSRLPVTGSDNDGWGSLLNDYLQQSLASNGTLITSATNSYTGTTNANLANGSKPGLVQLAGDLTTPVTAPKVVGLQGNPVAATVPSDGQVLTWSSTGSNWQPATPSGGGGGGGGYTGDIDAGTSTSVYGGTTTIDCGDST
jgi:hypothetical protein